MSVDVGATEDQYLQYRALSIAAVVALILGLISLPAIFFPSMLVLAGIGVIWGIFANLKVSRSRNELTGLMAARVGLVLCVIALIAGIARASYEYNTEVPAGYERISFLQLQPDETGFMPVSKKALELNGKKIFVKGYVYPDGQQKNIKQFVMVPDRGTCCFGGQPKLTDMIEVTLQDPNRTIYSYYQRKLGGILKVSTRKKPINGLDGVYYMLDADYVK